MTENPHQLKMNTKIDEPIELRVFHKKAHTDRPIT